MKKNQIINNLLKIVSKENLISNNHELSQYNKDWRGFYNYNSICLVFPNSKMQISNHVGNKFGYHPHCSKIPNL